MSLRVVRENLSRLFDVSWFDVVLKTGLLGLYVLIVWAAWTTGSLLNPFAEVYHYRIGGILMTFGAMYSCVMLLVTLARAVMVMTYRPTPSLSDADLPSVTVIIPAYN